MTQGNNMNDEFASLIETVKYAIQMELDGKKFIWLQASKVKTGWAGCMPGADQRPPPQVGPFTGRSPKENCP
jgi:hypothetical protein